MHFIIISNVCLKYAPKCMVSRLIFQKFSGEGLTEPPPQTPPPVLSRASPSVRASPSILGRFAPSTRASPSILGRFAPSIWASPSTFDWGSWFGPPPPKVNSWIRQWVTGPGSYDVNASDLHPRNLENDLNKYADDSYLIVPSINSDLVPEELDHIAENNLNLNSSKSKEMITRRPKTRPDDLPGQIAGIERVESMNILGVTLRYDLSIQEHVDRLKCKSAQTMYALRLLRSQGLNGPNLWEVTRATLVSRLTYASQAWCGMIIEGSEKQLEAVLAKAIRQGFLPPDHATFSEICERADQRLFRSILQKTDHVLHQRLPPVKPQSYNLRERSHDRVIAQCKSPLFRNSFIIRMLYKDSD